MTHTNNDYGSLLMEEINERLKLVQEALAPLSRMAVELRKTNTLVRSSKSRLEVTELVIKHQSGTINNHETRITHLETA